MASSSDNRRTESVTAGETARDSSGEPTGDRFAEPSRDRFASHQELRIGEIVLSAAGLPPEEREQFFRQLTVAEPGLLEEARHRLRMAAGLPSAFLAVPAAEILEFAELVTEPEEVPPPVVVGSERYELGRSLGQGGMARVYQAFDRQLHRPVALKLLERADPTTLRRVLREAQAQARVRHEYVLEVYETGELGGQPFIAMYYVDGPTLMEIRNEISLEQKVRLMAQVAEGLHAAHREGLVHHDVKPSNVLVEVTPSGKLKPWVADFGIATALDGGSSIWTTVLAGTPYYIAPERLCEELDIDLRSDIYSLGVTLYQLLTGVLPFDAPSLAEMMRQVREDQPAPLRSHVPALPRELEAIALKCLSKEPEERYPSALAVAEELWRFVDGEAVEAHTPTFPIRVAKAAGRPRDWRTGALAAAAVLIAVLASFAVTTSVRAKRVADEAVVALDNLATVYSDQGRYQEAEDYYRRTLALREEHLGPDHPSVARVLGDLAMLLTSSGQHAAGEAHMRRALAILGRRLPEDDWRRAQASSVLAVCLTGLGRFDEAESVLLASYPTLRDHFGASAPETLESLDRLATLYDAWGRETKAAEVRALRSSGPSS